MAYSIQDYISQTYGPGQNLATVSGRVNDINRNMQEQANYARIPGARQLEALSSDMIKSQLTGTVPTNVAGLLGQQAAERGVAQGVGMYASPATSSAYLRALGLTSMEQQEKGQRNLTAAYARNPAAPLFNASSLLMNQSQAGQLELERDRLAQQKREFDQKLKFERDRLQAEAQLRALSSGGGGGGGISAPKYASGTSNAAPMIVGGGDVFNDRGYVMSEQPWYSTNYVIPDTAPPVNDLGLYSNYLDMYTGGANTPAWQPYEGWGYQPTSSGSMYMGTLEGYTG